MICCIMHDQYDEYKENGLITMAMHKHQRLFLFLHVVTGLIHVDRKGTINPSTYFSFVTKYMWVCHNVCTPSRYPYKPFAIYNVHLIQWFTAPTRLSLSALELYPQEGPLFMKCAPRGSKLGPLSTIDLVVIDGQYCLKKRKEKITHVSMYRREYKPVGHGVPWCSRGR